MRTSRARPKCPGDIAFLLTWFATSHCFTAKYEVSWVVGSSRDVSGLATWDLNPLIHLKTIDVRRAWQRWQQVRTLLSNIDDRENLDDFCRWWSFCHAPHSVVWRDHDHISLWARFEMLRRYINHNYKKSTSKINNRNMHCVQVENIWMTRQD